MVKEILVSFCILVFGLSLSCNSSESQAKIYSNANEKFVETSLQNRRNLATTEDVNLLCSRIHELKRMPIKDDIAGDPIYDGLKAKGEEAIPCLIKKITDTTTMDDPREAPHVQDFKVGDAAFFMLHEITQEPVENALPAEVSKDWETEGVYAYFAYVKKSDNRKKIQEWWEKHYMRNKTNSRK